MKTMKRMRKAGAVVLALCLCLSLCVTAFAASSSDDEAEFTITVNNAADGETYTAYKIFDVTYTYEDDEAEDGQYAYSISEDSAWYSVVASSTSPFTLTQATDGSYIVSVNDGVEDADIISFFVDAGVPEGAEAAASVEVSDGTAILEVSNSGPGYYFVTTTLGSVVIIDTTNPTVEISDKNGQPTLEKYVHENTHVNDNDYWGKEDDADNNSDVLFEIVISNINGAVNLVLHDSMDDELSIPDESDFHMVSATLYTSNEDTEGTALVEDTDYTISIGECTSTDCTLDDCAFEVDFTGYDFSEVPSTGYIVLTYSLHMDTTGDSYDADYEQIENSAQVTYGTASASEEVTAETYTFGFEIYKYTGAYGTDVDIIFENVYYDFNAGEDAYIISCDDEDGNRWYAVFENTTCNKNGWQDATFTITAWVADENQATHIAEPTDITTVGDESGIYTWEFYYAGTMSAESQVHVREIETNGDEGITVLDEIDEAILSFGAGGPLSGAEFEVTNASDETAYFLEETIALSDGSTRTIYLLEGWLGEGETVPFGYTTTITSGSDGMIYVEGFDTGTYTVTETKAPDGYNLLTSSISVTISATYDEETGMMQGSPIVSWSYGDSEGTGVVNVENNAGTILPGTGGMGVYVFYIVGGALVLAAAVVLITRRRVNRAA